MALASGTRLGVYEVLATIGAGGMGEVYRAHDTKLNRDVAIKVLPDVFALDAERLARFTREAQTLASLNHPNIAAIYGLEEGPGEAGPHVHVRALVMELVEGEDLSERIARGAIPVDEALPIAKQIAEALEAAHEQGVIHRDLKPANIKVRSDGTVKVLDFGLAKALDARGVRPEPDLSLSPTITVPAMVTGVGVILGTAAYMSPEQARGRAVDKRADIWAFGCVLFEMLTGRRAFEAEDVSLTLAEIMKSEPDWSRLPAIPPVLKTFLRQCLRKDPRQRAQAMGDMRLALGGAFEIDVSQATSVAPRTRPLWSRAVPVVGAAALAGVAGWMINRPTTVISQPQRVSIVLPPDQSLAFGCTPCSSLTISPDGTQVAYVTTRADALAGGSVNGSLHVRSINNRATRDFPGTAGAFQPFFSPDGQWVAFFTNAGELKRISLAGGNPLTVLTNLAATSFRFGTWTEDQTMIVFGGEEGLRRVSVDGGSPATLTTVDRAQGEVRHNYPEIVAGTTTLLFTTELSGNRRRIETIRLDGTERRVVLENASAARYVNSGHLLFQRDGVLLVASFDASTLALGPAVPLVDDVRPDGPQADGPTPQLVVSRTGTLAYVPGIDPLRVIGTVSRTGVFESLGVPPDRINRVAVSHDGNAVAFDAVMGATTEVRMYDLTRRGTPTRVTQAGWSDSRPAWHQSGALAVISRKPDGTHGIFLKKPGESERLLASDGREFGPIRDSSISLSPDGTTLAYTVFDTVRGGTAADIWVAATGDTPSPHAWLNSPASEISPAFSPVGRWLAYVSDIEVYVRKYPQGEPVRVSTSGGFGPVWSGNGKELFFQSTIGGAPKLMAASISEQGDRVVPGKPVPLFDMRVTGASGVREQYSSSSIVGQRWDVFPDGQRFLMVRGADPQGAREIVLVQHWDEELKRLAPAK